MLSYQHIYHAGGQADVHKHSLLLRMLNVLSQKERPLSYMETHAGRGWYDLSAFEAQKTAEYTSGINRYLDRAELFDDPYAQLVKNLRVKYNNNNLYPGSPMIAKEILRAQDELFLMELHPGEFEYLRQLKSFNKTLGAEPKINIHYRDGYEGVLAFSPPKNRRGLVLIDPSYEIKSEYQKVVTFVNKLHKKWMEIVIIIWYPVLTFGHHLQMIDGLNSLNLPKTKIDEIHFNSKLSTNYGSGLYIVNTPWGF
jgi:23S rRNA (adenine2030-N6)-methyltransferase